VSKLKYSYPFIVRVSYLKDYDLLIDFNNTERRIADLADVFSREFNGSFKISKFQDFCHWTYPHQVDTKISE
jgi:hypothetical protein